MSPQNPSGERHPTTPTTGVPETLTVDELDAVSGGKYTPRFYESFGKTIQLDLPSKAGSKP